MNIRKGNIILDYFNLLFYFGTLQYLLEKICRLAEVKLLQDVFVFEKLKKLLLNAKRRKIIVIFL